MILNFFSEIAFFFVLLTTMFLVWCQNKKSVLQLQTGTEWCSQRIKPDETIERKSWLPFDCNIIEICLLVEVDCSMGKTSIGKDSFIKHHIQCNRSIVLFPTLHWKIPANNRRQMYLLFCSCTLSNYEAGSHTWTIPEYLGRSY